MGWTRHMFSRVCYSEMDVLLLCSVMEWRHDVKESGSDVL